MKVRIISAIAALSMLVSSFGAFAAEEPAGPALSETAPTETVQAEAETAQTATEEPEEDKPAQTATAEPAEEPPAEETFVELADAGTVQTVTIPVQADTYVRSNNNEQHGKDETIFTVANNGVTSRWIVMRYDLSSIADTAVITSAKLCVTGTADSDSNLNRYRYPFITYYVEDDSWEELEIRSLPETQRIIAPAGSNLTMTSATNPQESEIYKVDLTDAVRTEFYNDESKLLSMVLETTYDGTQTWGTQIWSKEGSVADIFKPHLEIELRTEVSEEEIAAEKDWAALSLGGADQLNRLEISEDLELPLTGENGSSIAWESSNTAVIAEDGTLTLPSYSDGTQEVTLTAYITNGAAELTKTFCFTVKPFISTEDWFELEREAIVSKYDNMTATEDIDFYTEGIIADDEGNLSGVSISWDSSDKDIISDDGKVTLPEDGSGAVITVTVTLEKDGEEDEFTIEIIIPREAVEARAAARESLEDVISYCEEYITTLYTGDEPGAVTQEAYDAFAAAIDEAETVRSNDSAAYAQYNSAMQRLIASGLSVFDTMKLDNTSVEGSTDNELVFSEYRAEAMKLVFEGETLLRMYPELYTEGDKTELKDKLDQAKAVLDGTYERPFNRNREFIRPREDEMIQRIIYNAYANVYGYSGTRFDLSATINWYRSANMLYDAYKMISIDPTIDGQMRTEVAIDTDRETSNIGNLSIFKGQIHPNNRNSDDVYIAQFDCNDLDAVIGGMSLELTNANTNNSYNMDYYLLPDSYDDRVVEGATLKDFTVDEYVDNSDAAAAGNADAMVPNEIASIWNYTSSTVSYLNRQSIDVYRGFQQDGNGLLTFIVTESVPSQNYSNTVYTSSWSNDEQRPKLVITTSDADMSKIGERIDALNETYEDFLLWYEPGTGLGKIDSDKYDAAVAAVKAAEDSAAANEEAYVIGTKIVDAYNAIREARLSRTLLSDIEGEDAGIFFDQSGAEALRQAITRDAESQQVYNEMKNNADSTDLQDYIDQLPLLGRTNYEKMGFTPEEGMFNEIGDVSVEYVQEHFKYSTNSSLSATAPDNAATMRIELNLPAGEYEGVGEGQGHVWFDNISGYGTTSELNILNPSFETGNLAPDNWTFVTNGSGNSEFRWESTSNLVQSGQRSAYLQNNDAEADSSLISDPVSVIAGEAYTVTFYARLDRVLLGNNPDARFDDSGVQMIIHWYDESGNEISSNNRWHNKRAGTGPLCDQADAIAYFMTGDKTYAEKAKYGILLKLNDLAQGEEEWIMTSSRPNGIDAYGGVQIGRNLCVLAEMYSLIKDADVFNDYEKELLNALAAESIRFVADYRDRSELDIMAFSDMGNWATDAWTGTAMMAMAMPEYKDSKVLLDNARYLLSGQINTSIGENGTYPESTRYMWAGASRYSLYSYCIAAYEGLNCFGNTYLGKLYEYAVQLQTPYYSYLGRSSNPPFGDNSLTDGSFAVAGAYLDEIYNLDPELAQALYKTWDDSGRPRISYSAEEVGLPALFTPTSFTVDDSYNLSLKSNADYPESIGAIFRDNFGVRGKETYVAINAPNRKMRHMHYDNGAIVFFANSEPLIMDPGVESYFDSTSLRWFRSSDSHSVLQFYNGSGYANAVCPEESDNPANVSQFVTNDNIDYAKVEVSNNEGGHVRNMAYLRSGMNVLVVWDDVTATTGARTNWGTQAQSVRIEGNKIISEGHFTTDLETTVLPENDPTRKISTEWGRMTTSWPKITVNGVRDTYINMEYIEQDAGKDFFTVHYPKLKTDIETLEATTLSQNGDVSVNKLQSPSGIYVLACTNGGRRTGTAVLEDGVSYVDLVNGGTVSGSVTLDAGEILFLRPDNFEDPYPVRIDVGGARTISTSDSVAVTSPYSATVYNQYGSVMSDAAVDWSVSGSGVSISQNGVITVEAGADNGQVMITARTGDVSAQYNVTLTRSERHRTSIEIEGDAVIAYDGSAVRSQYTATVYDQFGQPYSNDAVDWSVSGSGFEISENGLLTVAAGLEEGASATITAKSPYSEFVSAQLTVELRSSTPSQIIFENSAVAAAMPTKNSMTVSYAAMVTDQSGNPIDDEAYGDIIYSIDVPEELADYISIDESTGLITLLPVPEELVESTAGQTITVSAVSAADPNISSSVQITLKAEMVSRISISGPAEISVPEAGTETAEYTVSVYDQNGELIENYGDLDWEILDGYSGVFAEEGKVVAASYANSGTAVLRVSDTVDGIAAEMSIKIVKEESSPSSGNVISPGGGGSSSSGGQGSSLPPLSSQDDLPQSTQAPSDEYGFTDVPQTHWAAEAIYSLAEASVINGRSDTIFEPSANITRAEFAAIVVRAFDLGGSGESLAFEDVPQDAWYYDAVAAGVASGMINGVDESHFAPNDVIKRQDICAMLYRVLASRDFGWGDSEGPAFSDSSEISEYALEAVGAMSGTGIINGYEDGSFRPANSANRAEAAKIMYEVLKRIDG